MFNVQCMEEENDTMVEFLFANGMLFDATCSLLYKEKMKKTITNSDSFQHLGYEKMRTTL